MFLIGEYLAKLQAIRTKNRYDALEMEIPSSDSESQNPFESFYHVLCNPVEHTWLAGQS